MKVGKAKHGSGKNNFYVKRDEPFVARVLPALGKLADAGTWRVYYAVQWGFKNSGGKLKPFLDPFKKNFKNGMIEVESASRVLRETLGKQKDDLKAAVKANPQDQGLAAEYEKLVKLVKQYNLDSSHYMNVVTIDNKIGVLKLGTKLKNALQAQIDEHLKNGYDPLDIEKGMYFTFYKTNPSPTNAIQDWVHTVTPYVENVQAEINGQLATVQQQKYHTMDEAFISRLDSEAFELSGMYPAPTAEEVQRIVTEGTPAVDEILGVETENVQPSVGEAAGTTTAPATEATAPATEVATTTVAETPAAPVVETPPVTQAAIQPPVTTPPATETPAAPATPAAASNVSDDEFLKGLNIKTN